MPVNTYLLEIGLEEMPAQNILSATAQLENLARKSLASYDLSCDKILTFSTPRRLAIQLTGLPEAQQNRMKEIKGPPASIAREKNGDWSKAAFGFANKNSINPDALAIRNFEGKDYLFAVSHVKGWLLPEILKEEVPGWIHGLTFEKNMRWASYRMRFVRPIRWLLSLWNTELLPLKLEMLNAGKSTSGHRYLDFESKNLDNARNYEGHLRKRFVMADFKKRRQNLVTQIRNLEKQHGCRVEMKKELLDEVTNLVEWPTAMLGDYDATFLQLPELVLVTSMAVHQRYFPVYSNDKGGSQKLQPRFVAVRNGDGRGLETVCRGNARVLRARLSDAKFFFDEDCKHDLQEFQDQLDRVVFFQKRGSQSERIARIIKLSSCLATLLGFKAYQQQLTRRIAELCKFDLQTQMVNEFPELQGGMGEIYACLKKEVPKVCQGIREHYYPRNSQDGLPSDSETLPVAIADRLDMLAVTFSLKMIPTGSADPYALRRMAQGVVQIVLGLRLELDWQQLATQAVEVLITQQKFKIDPVKLKGQLVEFLLQRERWFLEEKEFRYDIVEALLKSPQGLPIQHLELAETLTPELNKPAFKKAVESVVRAVNIGNKYSDETVPSHLMSGHLTTLEEQAFYEALNNLGTVTKSLAERSPTEFLVQLYEFEPLITAFFDNVMVMDEDPIKRGNRLYLCKLLTRWSESRLDLREIIFPGKEETETSDEP